MDITSGIELSPQARLAISRKAIFAHMTRNHRHGAEHIGNDMGEPRTASKSSSRLSTFDNIRYAVHMWWNRHPASAAVELANPLLTGYARENPFKLMGISLAVGAALVVVRPWRMVSISTLLITAVKSSGLSNTLIAMLSSFTRHSENDDSRR